MADYFESVVQAGAGAKGASNWMMGELSRALKERQLDIAAAPVSAAGLAELLALVDRGTISMSIAKAVFEKMLTDGRRAGEIVADEGLTQISSDGELEALVAAVVSANPDAVAQVRAGKAATLGFLVGQVMKAAAGKANPKRVNELLRRALDERVTSERG
jgi:aspartyl-tRNA(Asn)/glutamyl-tRNA(Gln) amidotransferase subunit B